jgi:hypothetical protein
MFHYLKLFQKFYQVDIHLKLVKSFNNHTILISRMLIRKNFKPVLEVCLLQFRQQQHQANSSLEMKTLHSLKKVSSRWETLTL